ncbi:DUF916 and DUF3324 domain-containing protein [Fructilactobacillus hinvesii]|uniref:DUF916 and DUF3324 domain-containing protein n=1 Tax=Fructilactobacillus hinvesii TaxID=2940300 RepID=A0ABY5BWM2_9LACO|nr:DUF916 domain-containing protein [Fructilactobacillus hinvesii]USS88063.1 DUF916 and DUF3324 domain-containing protein [Fructilactobacillus hinvesii]
MRNSRFFRWGFSLVVALMIVSLPTLIKAQTVPSSFSVTPQLGRLPLQKGAGYFAIRSKAYTNYQLPLLITNDSDRELKVTTHFNNAVTAANGTINYANSMAQPRGKQSLTNKVIGSRTKHITLAPHTNQIVTYQINTGRQHQGITLGGITATAPVTKANGIQNDVTFVTGVSLNGQKNRPNLKKLRFDKANVASEATAATIIASVNNDYPQLLQHLRGKVFLKKGKQIISSKSLTNVNIAPNSKVRFDLPPKKISKGNYQVIIKLQGYHQKLNISRHLSINQTLN